MFPTRLSLTALPLRAARPISRELAIRKTTSEHSDNANAMPAITCIGTHDPVRSRDRPASGGLANPPGEYAICESVVGACQIMTHCFCPIAKGPT